MHATKPKLNHEQAIHELARRAGVGNRFCLDGLQKLLDENPKFRKAAGDVAGLAERAWVGLLGNGNVLAQEPMLRQVRALKSELAGTARAAIEKLLADYIGVS